MRLTPLPALLLSPAIVVDASYVPSRLQASRRPPARRVGRSLAVPATPAPPPATATAAIATWGIAAALSSSHRRRSRGAVHSAPSHLWSKLPQEAGDDAKDDDDDDDNELYYDDFGDFGDFLPGSSSTSSSSSPEIIHDDLGSTPIGSSSSSSSSSSSFMESLSSRITETQTAQIRKDALLTKNWKSGNWNVRGFSLDKSDPVREAALDGRGMNAGFVDGAAIPSAPRLRPRDEDDPTTSSLDTDQDQDDDASSSSAPSDHRPVHISTIVPDSSRVRGHHGGGMGVIAVGRTDGTVCLVKLGTEYLTKFTAVPKLRVDDPSVWGGGRGGGKGSSGNETASSSFSDGVRGGEGDDGESGSDDAVAIADVGGDDAVASGPTIRVESELIRSDVLRDQVRRLGLPGDLGNDDGSTTAEEEGGEVGYDGPTEDPFGDMYAMEDDDGNDGRRDDRASGNVDEEETPPQIPFEVLAQFRAHDPGQSIAALLYDDDTVYTAGGDSGEIRVWSMPDPTTADSQPKDAIKPPPTPAASPSTPPPPPPQPKKMIPLRSLTEGHSDRIVALQTLSSSGDPDEHDLLLSASRDGSFALWDTDKGDLVYRCQMVDEYSNSISINCAAVDTSSSSDDHTIFLGLSTGHVVGYVLSDVLRTASVGGTCPVPACRYLAHDGEKEGGGESGDGEGGDGGGGGGGSMDYSRGVTSILCAGEGTIRQSPGGASASSKRPRTAVLLTGGSDGTVKQWEVMYRKLPPSEMSAEETSFSPSFKLEHWPRLASQRMQRRAHLFQGHAGPVTALACTAGDASTKFLSASAEGTVRVWNPKTGAEMYRLDGFTESIRSLCLDRETLVTDGQEELVCLHDFNVDEAAAEEGHDLDLEW